MPKPNFFMYLPWSDDDALINGAEMFTQRIDKREWETYEESYVIDMSDLKNVKPNDALYIAGECGAGVNFIGSKNGQTLTARNLAAQFNNRLNPNHRTIHIWACYSGDGLAGNPSVRTGLVYEFWSAMRQFGFNKLTVFGYRMAVLDPFSPSQDDLLAAQILPGFRSLSETPDKYTILPGNANNWMAGIDPDGRIIPPAPLPKPASLPTSS